jgi:hypothetical protein
MAPQLCDIAGSSDRLCLAVAIFVGMMRQGQDGQPAHANKQEAEHKATTNRPPSLSITLLATSARAIPIETTVAAMSVEAAKARLATSSASATVRCSLPASGEPEAQNQ